MRVFRLNTSYKLIMRTHLKRIATLLLVAATAFTAIPFSVNSNDWIPTSVKSAVFDAAYYAANNADVKNAYGTNADALYNHFLTYGVKEGRLASPVFNAKYYLNSNESVQQACGTDRTAALLHYAETGYTQGLPTAPTATLDDSFTASLKLSYAELYIGESGENAVTVSDNTQWIFTRNENGTYTIKSSASGKVLTVSNGSYTPRSPITVSDYSGSSAQHWFIYERMYGCYVLSAECTSGLALDINGGSASAGATVQTYTYNSTQAQIFDIRFSGLGETYRCDVNFDGIINTKDILAVKKQIAGGGYSADCDADNDGVISNEDIEYINLNIGERYGYSYKNLPVDDAYSVGLSPDIHNLLRFKNKTYKDFKGVCAELIRSGCEIYNSSIMGGVFAMTLTNKKAFYHIYWVEDTKELSVVEALNGKDTLPPATPAVTSGSASTTVTQLKSVYINGMSYVVQLADRSFIIYDGGYPDTDDDLWNKLVELNGSSSGIVIRAWLLTHGHDDHYRCMQSFANNYASRVKVEYFLMSPINSADVQASWDATFTNGTIQQSIAKFAGAKTCYVHTGMRFTFCNTEMDILFTADDLFIEKLSNDFNNSSIVSKIYTDNKSAIFLGDAGDDTAFKLEDYYGNYLKSDMCQIAHHGVEDFPLSTYDIIRAPILFYPCSNSLYNMESRFHEVRQAMKVADYTKEILIHENASYTRSLD